MFDICPKATIDLSAIKYNYLLVKELIGTNTIMSAVVKNDAYGMGAQMVAEALYEAGCRNFWVAYLREAVDIRRVLPFDSNIYFLQGFHKSHINLIRTYKIVPTINSIEEFNEAKHNNINLVLHVDTGLSRLGIRESDVDEILRDISHEKVDYIISHLACSDDKMSVYNQEQKSKFDSVISKIRTVVDVKAGVSASAGVLLGEDFYYDMVRVGAFLYGIKNEGDSKIQPKNVLSLRTSVLQKYELEPGENVGYGATYITQKKTKLAVLSIGYADGIKRSLSNKGTVVFYDAEKTAYKANIIGRVSMDLLVCDVNDIPDNLTNINSEAYILCENYSINEMAEEADTIPYEILTSINFKSKRFLVEYV